eukprot:366026-Chlamydomonas_euryale.AAC.4
MARIAERSARALFLSLSLLTRLPRAKAGSLPLMTIPGVFRAHLTTVACCLHQRHVKLGRGIRLAYASCRARHRTIPRRLNTHHPRSATRKRSDDPASGRSTGHSVGRREVGRLPAHCCCQTGYLSIQKLQSTGEATPGASQAVVKQLTKLNLASPEYPMMRHWESQSHREHPKRA